MIKEFPEFLEFLDIPSNTQRLMKNNTLEDYKKAIREKYEVEKTGVHAHFLLQPSRARLRDLCFEWFKEHPNTSDLNSFRAFLGFDFDSSTLNKLKVATDKFRPLETFLKGETDLTDLAAVNMVAVLVNFQPRPFLKFAKTENPATELQSANAALSFEVQKQELEVSTPNKASYLHMEKNAKKNLFQKRWYFFIAPLLLVLLSIFGYQKWNQKECMQWNEDHYEMVDCKTAQLGLLHSAEKVVWDETAFALKKITVSDSTPFFNNEKPLIWYCKRGQQIEYFNGPGFHPENGKVLKPITTYMINKYVVKK